MPTEVGYVFAVLDIIFYAACAVTSWSGILDV